MRAQGSGLLEEKLIQSHAQYSRDTHHHLQHLISSFQSPFSRDSHSSVETPITFTVLIETAITFSLRTRRPEQSQKNKTKRLIKKLIKQAAALGPNGIILTNMNNVEETNRDVIVTTSHLAKGTATAIWVSEEVKANDHTLTKSQVVQACIDQCREEQDLSAAACFDECAGM